MVKKVVAEHFVAFDDTRHETLEAAQAYEKVAFLKQFSNLKPDKVEAAFVGETEAGKKLAAAFEKLGLLLRDKRFERGEKAPRGSRKPTGGIVAAPKELPLIEDSSFPEND